MSRVGAIAIELHDRFKAGCQESVDAPTKGFELRRKRGETTFLLRKEFAQKSPSLGLGAAILRVGTEPMSISLRNMGGNALSILTSDVMNRATSFVVYAMVAHKLGAFEFEQMSLALSLFYVFQILRFPASKRCSYGKWRKTAHRAQISDQRVSGRCGDVACFDRGAIRLRTRGALHGRDEARGPVAFAGPCFRTRLPRFVKESFGLGSGCNTSPM